MKVRVTIELDEGAGKSETHIVTHGEGETSSDWVDVVGTAVGEAIASCNPDDPAFIITCAIQALAQRQGVWTGEAWSIYQRLAGAHAKWTTERPFEDCVQLTVDDAKVGDDSEA